MKKHNHSSWYVLVVGRGRKPEKPYHTLVVQFAVQTIPIVKLVIWPPTARQNLTTVAMANTDTEEEGKRMN